MAAMQLQGYIDSAGRSKKWRTTGEGRTVSGAKAARFTREAVEQGLSTLCDRILGINDDPAAPYIISEAIAFGDFLSEEPRVQAPDVGIRLTSRKANAEAGLTEHKAEEAFLKQLRGKSAVVHIQPYEEWMSARTHRWLL